MSRRLAIDEAFVAVPLLSRLDSVQRARLAKLATVRTYKPGSVIVRQGDTSMSFYVVLSGSVTIQQELAEGRLPLRDMGPGGFFGEMGLVDDAPRSATVIALETTECALLTKWDFRNELCEDPDIALALLPILCERIRQLEAERAIDRPLMPAGLSPAAPRGSAA